MITETVCAERPVIRAISDFASAPCRRTRLSTSRSFCARIPAWFVPRCNGTGASSRKFSVSGPHSSATSSRWPPGQYGQKINQSDLIIDRRSKFGVW